jgi:hypothetical protein
VARQLAERVVGPEQGLRAIGHVLVAEGAGTHGLDHRAARRAVQLVVHAQRDAVAVALVALPAAAERRHAHRARGSRVHRAQVRGQRLRGEWRRHVAPAL